MGDFKKKLTIEDIKPGLVVGILRDGEVIREVILKQPLAEYPNLYEMIEAGHRNATAKIDLSYSTNEKGIQIWDTVFGNVISGFAPLSKFCVISEPKSE